MCHRRLRSRTVPPMLFSAPGRWRPSQGDEEGCLTARNEIQPLTRFLPRDCLRERKAVGIENKKHSCWGKRNARVSTPMPRVRSHTLPLVSSPVRWMSKMPALGEL
jgi:hypothetical protein